MQARILLFSQVIQGHLNVNIYPIRNIHTEPGTCCVVFIFCTVQAEKVKRITEDSNIIVLAIKFLYSVSHDVQMDKKYLVPYMCHYHVSPQD